LLPEGHVLVTGGHDNASTLKSAEIYDPTTDTWSAAGNLAFARVGHTATLMRNGQVLVSGGAIEGADDEVYDPSSNTWTAAGHIAEQRVLHTATLLADGRILVVGGSPDESHGLTGTATFDANDGAETGRAALIDTVTQLLTGNNAVELSGSGFRPNAEASGGGTHASATNYPIVQVVRLDNGQTHWLPADPSSDFGDAFFGSSHDALLGFPDGHLLVTVFVNGIASAGHVTVVARNDGLFGNGFD